MEEGLGMNKDRKRVDIREEYFVSRRLGRRSRRGVDGSALRCGQAGGLGAI
jgi:hypothetical protein